jgi:lipoyl(octanoyl) transferase
MAIEVSRYSPSAAPYLPTLQAMRRFTAERGPGTADQIWLLHHPPVFTLGQAGKAEHLHDPGDTPVVRTERGGQVTYHGPGQVVAYLLLDLRRRGLLVRDLVCLIERAVMATTALHGVQTMAKAGAPGVYLRQADGTPGAKIASLGLKVSRGCTYHGVALNVAMDLEPFSRIDPCGFPGLAVTDLQTQAGPLEVPLVADELARCLLDQLESPT